MLFPIVLIAIILILLFSYFNGKYNEKYWEKRGVVFHRKNTILGPFGSFVMSGRSMFEVMSDLYEQYRGQPAVGVSALLTPALYVLDPNNVQHVLQADFPAFSHRGVDTNESDVLANNVLFLNGPKWKLVRQNMTPLFTATKLKSMHSVVDKCASDFVEYLKGNPEKLKGNAFDTLSTFCSAAMTAAVFGISTSSIFDSPFLEMAKNIGKVDLLKSVKFTILNVSPKLSKMLGVKAFSEHEKFFVGAISKILRQRENDNIKAHDFADICVNIKKNGVLKDQQSGLELEPTDELLAAQGFFFFIAGVEPIATAMFGTLYELGKNPEILKRAQKEVDEAFVKGNGKLSFDDIAEMKYLEAVLNEALRLHPPIGFLTRRCVKDTVLPVGNIPVEKGTKILTPIIEIHRDARYYDNPDVFDPDRFVGKPSQLSGSATFMPFGRGGRLCIGERFARVQAKAGLIYIIRNFNLRSLVPKEGIKYKKDLVAVRMKNTDVEFSPRTLGAQ